MNYLYLFILLLILINHCRVDGDLIFNRQNKRNFNFDIEHPTGILRINNQDCSNVESATWECMIYDPISCNFALGQVDAICANKNEGVSVTVKLPNNTITKIKVPMGITINDCDSDGSCNEIGGFETECNTNICDITDVASCTGSILGRNIILPKMGNEEFLITSTNPIDTDCSSTESFCNCIDSEYLINECETNCCDLIPTLLLTSQPTTSLSSPNLLSNPTFANGLTGWITIGNVAGVICNPSSDGQDDTFAAECSGSSNVFLQQNVDVSSFATSIDTGKARVSTSAYFKNIAGARDAGLFYEWHTDAITCNSRIGQGNHAVLEGDFPSNYTLFVDVDTNIPINTKCIIFRLKKTNGVANFDNARLVITESI